MSNPIITVDRISKRYRLGQIGMSSLRESVDFLMSWRHKPPAQQEIKDFWALRDISFEVQRGEVLGIIGRNGAGKSTLLKILSRITEPTSGGAILRGRVASLLEVGTGFHPELTGRENIFLNGAILGMRKAEIKSKFDEIVAFAELDKFIDTPVKRYSSGMYVRLAFAVAAHLDPEILLVDEVLAVGDASFQKKCLGKMKDVAKHGRTVLFVSHNMVAVQSLCQKSIWLDQGRIELAGIASNVTYKYLTNGQNVTMSKRWDDLETAPGNEICRLRSIKILGEEGLIPNQIGMITPFFVETEYVVQRANIPIHLTFHLINEQGLVVLTTANGNLLRKQESRFQEGIYRTKCHIPGNFLNSGVYGIKVILVRDRASAFFIADNLLSFEIIDTQKRDVGWHGKEPGIVQPDLKWEIEHLTT